MRQLLLSPAPGLAQFACTDRESFGQIVHGATKALVERSF
jgi:hypothetical protein